MDLLIRAPVGLLPVLIFLVVLVYMDSYKLVGLKTVLAVIAAGGVVTVLSYFSNAYLMDEFDLDRLTLVRYVAPVTEECLKALIIVYLFRSHRIGFLVDSAIMGFAVGAGFGFVENIYYLARDESAHIGVAIVRGFGTAVMHGGVAAIFAIISQTLTERNMKINPVRYLPGLAAAMLLHAGYNYFVLTMPPILMTLVTLMLLPPILHYVFVKSAQHMHEWLQLDFDADAKLLEQINSGQFAQGKIGRFLHDLRDKFEGPVVVDMLCYLRLYTELALRAKGVLMMRENGLDAPVGERTREKFTEMEYLESSIGKTGLLALKPFLHMTRKDLWQLNVLEK